MRGGVVIFVHKEVSHAPLPAVDIDAENIAVQLQDKTIIRGVSNAPRHNITDRELIRITKGSKVLVIGDFNAKRTIWKNNRNNRNCITLFKYTLTNNMAILVPVSHKMAAPRLT